MKEYKFLKVARTIFKVLAWLILAIAIVIGVIVLITGGSGVLAPDGTIIPQTPRLAGLLFMAMGAFYFLILFALSEIIGILLDIKTSCKPSI
ncbi:hypothetical protein ACFL0T_06355 [Candidatus Omnitrophota bacterium]